MKIVQMIRKLSVVVIIFIITNSVQSQSIPTNSNSIVQISRETILTPDSGLSIPSGGSGVLQSATGVRLKNGFHAHLGSYFHAFISPVDSQSSSGSRVANNSVPDNNNAIQASPSQPDLFYLSPNPSTGVFHIMMAEDISKEKDICIYNSLGKIIYRSLNNSNQDISFDISTQSKGIYLIKVMQDGKAGVKKIVLI